MSSVNTKVIVTIYAGIVVRAIIREKQLADGDRNRRAPKVCAPPKLKLQCK
jgi:hypothetical protein